MYIVGNFLGGILNRVDNTLLELIIHHIDEFAVKWKFLFEFPDLNLNY